jgi:hypothetical protein
MIGISIVKNQRLIYTLRDQSSKAASWSISRHGEMLRMVVRRLYNIPYAEDYCHSEEYREKDLR